MNAERMRLLNPGPVTLSPRVRRALAGPDLCHREPDYAALQTDVCRRLLGVYPETEEQYTPILLTGSGTAAVEAMVGSLVPPNGKALVVANGTYGERIAAMLRAQGKSLDLVRSEWTEPMNLAETRRRLQSDGGITHVIAVHHETTTGRLNDVAALGAICRERGVALLLDAISSFGGERLDFAAWNLEGVAATANKCLHGVPGMAFVLVRTDALHARPSGACGLYLDLFRHYQEQRGGFPLFTPAVQVLYALQEALKELAEQGGWQARQKHYLHLSRLLRDRLPPLGAPLLLRDDPALASMLTSFWLPQNMEFKNLFNRLKERRFVIYPGQQALQEKIFRLAVMGDLTPADLEEFITVFADALFS